MEVDTAHTSLPFGFQYNNQETLPSRYVRHQQVYLYPTQQNTVSSTQANPSIKFLIPPNGFLDTKSSYVAYNAKAWSTDNTDVLYFVDSTDCWIQRCLLLTPGGTTIEEIRDANIKGAINRRDIEPAYEQSVGRASLNMLQSANMSEVNKTLKARANLRYVCELNQSGFLSNAYSFLPLKAMSGQNSNSLQLELQFAPISQMCIGHVNGNVNTIPAGTIKYEISNIVFVANIIYDNEKEMQLMEQIKSIPIVLSYKTCMNYSQPLPDSKSSTIQIAEFQEQVLQLDTVFQTTTDSSNITKDSTKFINPTSSGITQYQCQVGSSYFPSQAVVTTTTGSNNVLANTDYKAFGEQYYNYAIANQKQRKYYMGFYPDAITNAYTQSTENEDFILSVDLRIVPDDSIGDPMYFQYYAGLNLKMNPQPIQLKLSTGASPSTNEFQVYSFTEYISNLVVQANELYVIS